MEWISVQIELPKVGEYVLVYWGEVNLEYDDPGQAVLMRHDIVDWEDKTKVTGYGWADSVHGCSWGISAKYWKPLTAPPKD